MPFVSKAQARWGNSPAGLKALGGKKSVAEWNSATDFSSLPDKKMSTSAIQKEKVIRHPGALKRAQKKVQKGK